VTANILGNAVAENIKLAYVHPFKEDLGKRQIGVAL
jgi:hypothetical protein